MSQKVTFSTNQVRFIEWLANTKYDRSPPTQEMLADELGVRRETLSRWKQLPGFKEAVTQRARELLGDDLPEIYGALRREAAHGSYQHIKLALELVGEYAEKQRVEHSGKIQTEDVGLTDEDRANRILTILDRVRERRTGQLNSGD